MGKKVFSLCMVLVLCLGLLPVTALAVDTAPQTLYVGSTTISTGYWTSSDGGKVWTSQADEPEGNNYIYYDGQGTLKLHNVTIQGADNTGSPPYGAGIYALCSQDQPVALTIELIGTNTITGYYGIFLNAEIDASSYGTNATLTITGENNGSLGVSGSDHGIYVKSGTGNAYLNIKNVAVTSSTKGDYAAGVYVMSSKYATNSPNISLAVDGGNLTASGTGSSDGIWFYVGSSQATGATTSLTVSENAIVDARNGGIKASDPNLNNLSDQIVVGSGTGTNGGIVFDGTEGTVYGDVTLDESLTINQGETLTIPEGSTLNTNGNLTNNGTIVNTGGTLNGEPGGTIVSAPAITTQPQDKSVTAGNTATFTVAASGENLSYQWQQSTDNGQNWTDIGGATDATYTEEATTTSTNGYQYRCVVSNSAGSVTSEVATLTVNEPAPTTYTITADVDPVEAGTVTVNGSGTSATVTAGDEVTLAATANSGYRFVGWMEGDQTVSTDTTYAFQASSNRSLTAKFEKVYTVTVNASGGGTATADKNTAAEGKTVTLTATPDSGYRFTGWTSSDGVTFANASSESTTFTMPAGDVTVTAGFTRISSGSTTYAITAPDAENGAVRVSPGRASRGTTVTITVTPDEGYELESLTVLDSRDNEIPLTDKGDGKYTFTMPAGRVTVEASFAEIAPEPLPFGDVDDGDWFADAARFVYENGMMNGVSETSFAPHATTSRSMIVTILYRLEGEPVVDYAMDFTDVAGDAYYAEAVRWAASEGIVGGYGGGLFGSDDAVTREQLAVILYRYAAYKGYDVSIGEDTNILSYADFADLSEYAISAMQWACGAGIITGVTDATLVPQGTATRAQCAAMLMRFVEAIGEKSRLPGKSGEPCAQTRGQFTK